LETVHLFRPGFMKGDQPIRSIFEKGVD